MSSRTQVPHISPLGILSEAALLWAWLPHGAKTEATIPAITSRRDNVQKKEREHGVEVKGIVSEPNSFTS